MKILLDECLPVDFRHSFPTHDAHTAQWAGLKNKKNGELLRAAEIAGWAEDLDHSGSFPHESDRRLISLSEYDLGGAGNDSTRANRFGSKIELSRHEWRHAGV